MANGDTKTEQMLDVLGNGGDASQFRGCCNTKSQSYILDAIDRVQSVEDEVEELRNNPDVVDIVDTYASLQAYDTQHLTDKDVIRVLNDETHNGESTYYRFTKSSNTWTYIGTTKQYTDFVGTDGQTAGAAGLVPAPATTDADKFLKSDGTWSTVSGGGGSSTLVKVLDATDYNYPVNNPTSVNPGMLAVGIYFIKDNTVNVFNGVNALAYRNNCVFIVSENEGDPANVHEMMVINDVATASSETYKVSFYYVDVAAGSTSPRGGLNGYGLLDSGGIVDNLNSISSKRVLSAKQGSVLKDMITPTTGSGAPTSSTAGVLGKIYIDTSTNTAYMCVESSGGSQTWKQITV